jgi:predicted ATPase
VAINDLERLGLAPDALPYLTTLVSSSAGSGLDLELGDGAVAEFGAGLRGAYADWLRGLCRRQPVVLAFHDLHWADHRTLELVESLLPLLGEIPLTIAATSRLAQDSNERRLLERARTEHADHFVELRLGPLSDAEAEQLVAQLGPGELADDARREVISRAEGNALYVEQLLRSLLESGGLAQRRTWALTIPAAQLPTGLESLLVARIAALPRDARRVAQVAAVFGRTFSPIVVARASGIADVEANLARLVRADIVRETRPGPDRELAFTHGLLQEAALSTLTRARRRELYRAVAAATEQVFAESVDDELERLAFYHARGDDLAQALVYLERAAERASSLGACTQSVDLLQRAAAVAEKLDNPEAQERIAGQLSPAGG